MNGAPLFVTYCRGQPPSTGGTGAAGFAAGLAADAAVCAACARIAGSHELATRFAHVMSATQARAFRSRLLVVMVVPSEQLFCVVQTADGGGQVKLHERPTAGVLDQFGQLSKARALDLALQIFLSLPFFAIPDLGKIT